jgi:UDP-2-acetamido-3-amino-2,3-dideoxy-glucuronate N-acetyltransferase
MVGVPARRVGWMCQCGERLHLADREATCERCASRYRDVDGTLIPIVEV